MSRFARASAPGFHELTAAVPATVGVAIAPPDTEAATLGPWSTGVAWSTIKVPLAIAALRTGVTKAEPLVTGMITASDNAAAEQLWSALGPPDRAAQQVQAVLRDGGDTATRVESRRLRPEFTAFGQTQWPLARQATFAAHLPRIAGAGPVVELMGQLIDDHRWGLAADGTAAKGGWGPGRGGGLLVRQFGIVSTPAGQVGVALAAEPDDGTFDTGIDTLNRMRHWLAAHKCELSGGGTPGA